MNTVESLALEQNSTSSQKLRWSKIDIAMAEIYPAKVSKTINKSSVVENEGVDD